MRKNFAIIAAVSATLGLAACAAPEGDEAPAEAEVAEVEAPVEVTEDGTMVADEGGDDTTDDGETDGLDPDGGNPIEN